MYNLPRTINFFLVAYRLLPFVTDHFCSCVCVCQEYLRSRSGDGHLNTYMIRRTRAIFVLSHTDCFLLRPIFMDLAWECVTDRWRDLQAMHIWIHVTIYFFWAAYRLLSFLTDHFFSCVCMCHGWLNRRSGDDFLKTCVIRRAYSSTLACQVPHMRQRRLNYKEWWYGSSSIVG